MISLTWNYKISRKLIACGIDAEQVERFAPYAASDEHPMPFVFSGDEIKHFKELANPVKGFCAAFCCKEALYKAISQHYNFPDCELFLSGNNAWQILKLSNQLCEELKIDTAIARINFIPYSSYMECLATVYVFKDK